MDTNSQFLIFFANLIEKELGIVYSEANFFQLQIRLEEIVKILNLSGLEELYSLALRGLDLQAKQLLLDVATNNETSFFRDPKIFETIASEIVPEWVKHNPPSSIFRVWSAACSFGQEPYSLAILLSELSQSLPTLQWQILATDIAEKAISRTKEGVYTQLEIQRGLSAKRLVQNFAKETENTWKIHEFHKKNLQVHKQNLLQPFSWSFRFDLILCRNVLIYQRVEHKKKVVENMLECLQSKGHLILGAGESLLGVSEKFDLKSVGGTVLYTPSKRSFLKSA